MKTFFKYLLSFVLVANSWAFTLNTSNGSSYDVDEIVIDLADNCQNLGITTAKLATLLQRAVDEYWNAIPISSLNMRFGSIVTVSNDFYTKSLCSSFSGPGNNICDVNPYLIYMSAQVLVSCNDEFTESGTNLNGFQDQGILGSTLNNNIVGDKIQSSVFLINDIAGNSFNSLTDNDKTSVLAHELGHAIGLGHSQVEEALMWYQRLPLRHKLGWDDIDGASYLYPSDQPLSCNSIGTPQIPSFLFGLLLTFFGIFSLRKFRKSKI